MSNKSLNERTKALYESVSRNEYRPGNWDPRLRTEVQDILHVEDSCKSVLAVIEKLQSRDPENSLSEPVGDIVAELKRELFRFKSYINDREFLRDLSDL